MSESNQEFSSTSSEDDVESSLESSEDEDTAQMTMMARVSQKTPMKTA